MRILFDQGTPVPLRRGLAVHDVATTFEKGWATLANGELFDTAEAEFDILVTTDQNLPYQQNLPRRRLAVLILPTTSWPEIAGHLAEVSAAVAELLPGTVRLLSFQR